MPPIPDSVEQAILRGIPSGPIPAPPAKPSLPFWRMAAAAMLAACLCLFFFGTERTVIANTDINHDGHINALDVHALQVALQHGRALDRGDANGDQKIGLSDLDALWQQALRIKATTETNNQIATNTPSRFITLPIIIDPHGQPLAAWHADIECINGHLTLVGLESGEDEAYATPPRTTINISHTTHLPVGQVSAYALDASKDHLPTSRTRVATLHLYWEAFHADSHQPDLQLNIYGANTAATPIDNLTWQQP